MTIESLVVWRPEDDDFLERFVARHGGGAHHITFKVPDLAGDARRVRAPAASRPSGVRLDDPHWQEAFLQPRDAHGTVVQLAQTDEPTDLATLLPQVERHGAVGHARLVARAAGARARSRDPAARGARQPGPHRGGRVLHRAARRHRGRPTTSPARELAWPGGGRIRVEDARAGRASLRLRRDRARVRAPCRVAGVPVVVA